MCRQDLRLSQSLWSQTTSVSLSKQGCPSVQWKPVSCSGAGEAHEEKLDVFITAPLTLKGRHRLFDWSCRDQLPEHCSCFLFHWRCFVDCWDLEKERIPGSSSWLSYIILSFFPCMTHPCCDAQPTQTGLGFVFCSWIHPVNVNMENKYISIQYFEDQLSILSPLKEGCFCTYQCKMKIKRVIVGMQFKSYSFSTPHLFIVNEN